MILVAIVFLAVAAGCFLYRLLRGPSIPDRVVALDGVLSVVVSGIIVGAAKANSDIRIGIIQISRPFMRPIAV